VKTLSVERCFVLSNTGRDFLTGSGDGKIVMFTFSENDPLGAIMTRQQPVIVNDITKDRALILYLKS
jgi:hypothetical protein